MSCLHRKRRCRICGEWFRPHPRAKGQQRVCGRESCQRERHRQACVDWHHRNPGYDRERRLAERLERPAPEPDDPPPDPLQVDPLAQIRWSKAREAIGGEATLIIEACGRAITGWARDAIIEKTTQYPPVTDRVLSGPRDALFEKGL